MYPMCTHCGGFLSPIRGRRRRRRRSVQLIEDIEDSGMSSLFSFVVQNSCAVCSLWIVQRKHWRSSCARRRHK
jgi:hypothetical protein